MFCSQCQEAVGNTACTVRGACGKHPDTADLQDLLITTLKSVALLANAPHAYYKKAARYVIQALFATITNANFDNHKISALILKGLAIRDELKVKSRLDLPTEYRYVLDWAVEPYSTENDLVRVLTHQSRQIKDPVPSNPDLKSLIDLVVFGMKGVAAYAEHAAVLGFESDDLYAFILSAIAQTVTVRDAGALTALVLETGKYAVDVMALLDKANTTAYGNPEMTTVQLGVRKNPGILISGHDLHDMEALLAQTAGTGVDVYTHSEMLAANYYPAFKKYPHFVGNYGNAWWKQDSEFTSFNGPILMTTNCITPVQDAYKDRIWTTGMAGFPQVKHIEADASGKKDFSAIISQAKTCAAPREIETGTLVGGFAHKQVELLADKVVAAIKSGALKKFVVMAGCDGRHKSRDYFSDLADQLPKDMVILTAGCAKYRYNKKKLGDIGGIPRVLDAGQCNDSYSLAVTALKLKEIFAMNDINDLPIDFAIAWYEQKAVAVLLALLHLGFKNIRLGPTLPAFLSPGVAKVLVDTFGIQAISTVERDIAAISA